MLKPPQETQILELLVLFSKIRITRQKHFILLASFDYEGLAAQLHGKLTCKDPGVNIIHESVCDSFLSHISVKMAFKYCFWQQLAWFLLEIISILIFSLRMDTNFPLS